MRKQDDELADRYLFAYQVGRQTRFASISIDPPFFFPLPSHITSRAVSLASAFTISPHLIQIDVH